MAYDYRMIILLKNFGYLMWRERGRVQNAGRNKADRSIGQFVFLGGSKSLISIENPNAKTDRELVMFRDSFGSSIAPLLAEDYAKITLVDIRYLPVERIGNYIDFKDQDVLFLYSTSVLNHSETLK